MLNDVVENLTSYGNYILFSVAILSIIGILGSIGVHFISWKSKTLKFYGVFVEIKWDKLLALSLVVERALFFLAFVVFDTRLELEHILYGAILTILIHLVVADIKVLVLDFLYTAMIYGGLYSFGFLSAYLSGVQRKVILIAILVVIIVFIILSTVYSALLCIQGIVRNSEKRIFRSNLSGGKKGLLRSNNKVIVNQADKRKFKLKFRSLIPHGVLLLTGLMMALLPNYLLNRIDIRKIHQDIYQYTLAGKNMYTGENTISKSRQSSIIEHQDKLTQLEDTPLYYVNEDKILIPSVIAIIQPKLLLTNRVENMSLLYRTNGKYYIENDKSTVAVSDFFLYDGKDTYLFFEPITVAWEGQEMSLSPFSYVTVKYNQTITVYNRDKDNFTSIKTNVCNVMTTLDCGATINLSSDILSEEDGQEMMLFLQPNLLEDLR